MDGKISAQNLHVNWAHSRLPQVWGFWCGWALLHCNGHPMSVILFFTAYSSLTSSYIVHSWQGQLTEKNLYPVLSDAMTMRLRMNRTVHLRFFLGAYVLLTIHPLNVAVYARCVSMGNASFGSGINLTSIPNIDDDLDDVFCRSIPHSLGS
jgi:hypothetical protein